jgi:glycerophosphoryl diester phosphodiesterase
VTNPLLDPNARLVIGHRGNRAAVAENTLESLGHAVDIGVDAIEFDVRVTRDGVAVIMHDPTVDRTTNGRGLLQALSYSDVQALEVGATTDTPGAARLRVPSLEQVLDRVRETALVIEVKELAAVDATLELIRRFGAQSRVLIGSAETLVMERFYESSLRLCASMRDAAKLIPIALAGLRPSKLRYHVLSVTPRFRGFPIPVLRMAAAARRANVPTQVWTVNDPAVAKRLWLGGVSGIVTDDPAAMLRARAQ